MTVCRLCGNGPCISTAQDTATCPWSAPDMPKKSYEPDPRPVKKTKTRKS